MNNAKNAMKNLSNKHILVGVTGGIAAYKSVELVRRLREHGAEVQVVMTEGAKAFVTPLTFQAVSGQPVHGDLLDPTAEAGMGHIELARWADLVVVVPASANFMARFAHGMADDLLTTLCLATTARVVLAPAMNQQMWQHSATQSNAALLQQRGVTLWGPASGSQACGEVGPGRLLEVPDLLEHIANSFNTGLLAGIKMLITAGPTIEAIDPVRYFTNRSSGKMGYALAQAAAEAGAIVTLISGPTHLTPPAVHHFVAVTSALDMHQAVLDALPGQDIYVGAAAVADYRCENIAPHKLKKSDKDISLTLVRNPDIIAEVAKHSPHIYTVGFAAQTEDLDAQAKAKLVAKGLDMIAANVVGEGKGFQVDHNTLSVYWQGGQHTLPTMAKYPLACQLIQLIARNYETKR
jgi:phosphopantothenoylcysteine decarboxylase/phosphopantothenate--cysteine ligase